MNQFAHSWSPLSFDTAEVAKLCRELWVDFPTPRNRDRFVTNVAVLLCDFAGRAKQVKRERRRPRRWRRTRGIFAWELLAQRAPQ